MFHRNND